MSGRNVDRLAHLNDVFRDHGIRAVIATRGGAGAYRIADRIDFNAVRNDPKPMAGFSDITNVHTSRSGPTPISLRSTGASQDRQHNHRFSTCS